MAGDYTPSDCGDVIASALARRSIASVGAYAVLWVTVLVSTSLWREHRLASVLGMVGVVLIAGARSGLVVWWRGGGPASIATWRAAFRGATLVAGAYWGAFAAVVAAAGLHADAFVVLLFTTGIVAGATTSLSPDLPLVRAYIVAILLPIVGVLLSLGSAGWPTATAVAFFLLFAQLQAGYQHRDFIDAIHRNRKLAARADALSEARQQAEAAAVAAETASRAKTAFLANMSHEIRTPMTAIIGFAELLRDPETSDTERVEHLRTISRSGRHLLTLLNDVLDLAKIESSGITIHASEGSIVEILADLDSLMRVRSREAGLEFTVRLATPIPSAVVIDSSRVRQILINLTANAIKFTERGEVEVSVSFRGVAVDAGQLDVHVRDTGVGIAADDLAGLFKPFTQVDVSMSRRHQGSGLGLDISKRLAQLMGGDISVISAPGVGSTFSFSLPLRLVEGSPMTDLLTATPSGASEAQSPHLGGVRVLVAEDSPDIRELVGAVLRRAGATVACVENGLQAVDAATLAMHERRVFDVVLMDMQMPEMDGYQATDTLRRRGYQGPIVALTAHALSDERERCLAAGCDEHLTKPVDREHLLHLVAALARTAGAPSGVTAQSKRERRSSNAFPRAEAWLYSSLADDPIVAPLLPAFVAGLAVKAEELARAVEADDRAALRDLAHALAGGGASYGFDALTAQARRLERVLKGAEPVPMIVGTANELRLLCDMARVRVIIDSARAK